MFRDILSSSRVIFIGLVFFVLVVGGSLLYSWHVHRTTDAEVAETQRKVQPLKNDKEARTAAGTVDTSTVDFEHVETDPETDDSQIPDDKGVSPIDETSEMLDMADAFLPNDFVSEEAPAEVPVSPFGFGPYPEVPVDFFKTPIWQLDLPDVPEDVAKNLELIDRVLIKLWQQGDRDIVGGFLQNGKVYPNYPDTVYVEKSVEESDDKLGKTTYSQITGPPGTGIYHQDIREGNTPAHLTLIPMDNDQGIDPYSFLDLGGFSQ